jgi:hypothetical protein
MHHETAKPAAQLFFAPAAAQAARSAWACALLRGPPGGMFPPYQLRHDPEPTRLELVPLMYRWPWSQEYPALALYI